MNSFVLRLFCITAAFTSLCSCSPPDESSNRVLDELQEEGEVSAEEGEVSAFIPTNCNYTVFKFYAVQEFLKYSPEFAQQGCPASIFFMNTGTATSNLCRDYLRVGFKLSSRDDYVKYNGNYYYPDELGYGTIPVRVPEYVARNGFFHVPLTVHSFRIVNFNKIGYTATRAPFPSLHAVVTYEGNKATTLVSICE